MGIVAYCPRGHRVKVKDALAGKKGICPECGERFRIPQLAATGTPTQSATTADGRLPQATVASLDPAVAAGLPRVVPLDRPPERKLDPVLAARPELTWHHAVPGGAASPPLTAEAMQQWLESGAVSGAELVWRSDWPDWLPIRRIFPGRFAT